MFFLWNDNKLLCSNEKRKFLLNARVFPSKSDEEYCDAEKLIIIKIVQVLLLRNVDFLVVTEELTRDTCEVLMNECQKSQPFAEWFPYEPAAIL